VAPDTRQARVYIGRPWRTVRRPGLRAVARLLWAAVAGASRPRAAAAAAASAAPAGGRNLRRGSDLSRGGRPGERRRRNRDGRGRPEADQPEDREGSWDVWRPIDEGEASAHRDRGLRVAHVRRVLDAGRQRLEVDVDAGDEPGYCRAAVAAAALRRQRGSRQPAAQRRCHRARQCAGGILPSATR
jgi:hypothetical protein